MAETTEIAWADSTFNPWIGCTKVGPGCDNCYAEALMDTRWHKVNWGAGKLRQRTSPANLALPARWEREHEAFAAENGGRRRRVFCASLSDVFDNEVPTAWRDALFATIKATPHLDWLILTKRVGNVKKMVPSEWIETHFPLNVWLGITVVNQEEADRDIPKLLDLRAMIRWLSMEPLLAAVDLFTIPNTGGLAEGQRSLDVLRRMAWEVHGSDYVDTCGIEPGIDWVVVGGESGPKARDFDIGWAKSIVAQCREADVPVLVKQLGAKPVWSDDDEDSEPPHWGRIQYRDKKGGDINEWPQSLRVREYPELRRV